MEKTFDCGCKVGLWTNDRSIDLGLNHCALHGAARNLQSACAHVLETIAQGTPLTGDDKRLLVSALVQSGYKAKA